MKTMFLLGAFSSLSATTGVIYSQKDNMHLNDYIECVYEERESDNFENMFFNENCIKELKKEVQMVEKKELKKITPISNDINKFINSNPKNEKELNQIIKQLNKTQEKYMDDYYKQFKFIKDTY